MTTTLITDHAIEWLEKNISDEKPFCVLVNHKAPHRNWMPDFPNMHLFEDVDFPEPVCPINAYKLSILDLKIHIKRACCSKAVPFPYT